MKRKVINVLIFTCLLLVSLIPVNKIHATNDTQYQIHSDKIKRINTAKVQLQFKCRHSFDHYNVKFTYKDKNGKNYKQTYYVWSKHKKNQLCKYTVPIGNQYKKIQCTLKIYDNGKLKRTETVK